MGTRLGTSALAQHATKTRRNIDFDATELLVTAELLQKRITREAAETEKRDDGSL